MPCVFGVSNSFRRQFDIIATVVDEVDRRVKSVSAFDDNEAGTERGDRGGGASASVWIVTPERTSASGRFGVTISAIGRSAEFVDCPNLQETIATLGDHHRIDDEIGDSPGFEPIGDGRDNRGTGEHPRFRGACADIFQNRIDMLDDMNGVGMPRQQGHRATVSASQSRTVWSSLALAMSMPSGLNATWFTSPVCRANLNRMPFE